MKNWKERLERSLERAADEKLIARFRVSAIVAAEDPDEIREAIRILTGRLDNLASALADGVRARHGEKEDR